MEFSLSTDEMDIQEMARRFMADRDASALWSEEEPGAFDEGVYREMAGLGFFSLAASQEVGGMGMSQLAGGLVLEAAGYQLFPGPLLGHYAALAMGTNLSEGLMTDLVTGAKYVSPAYGWRGNGIPASVTLAQEGSLRGKTAAGHAHKVDRLMVTAATEHDDLVAVALVDTRAAGVTIEPTYHADLSWAATLVAFEGCEPEAVAIVPASRVFRGITTAAGLTAAYQLGSCQRVLDDTVEYAKNRKQFGNPIGSFQTLKHRIADMHINLEHTRSLMLASLAVDPARDGARLCLLAKLAADQTLSTAAESALQIYAGIGFTWESQIHRYVRAAIRLAEWPWPSSTVRRLIRHTLVGDDPYELTTETQLEAV